MTFKIIQVSTENKAYKETTKYGPFIRKKNYQKTFLRKPKHYTY